MFREVTAGDCERFRLIYHQTTPYSNPIIESVLYQQKGGGIFYWGDLIDGNYLIFHRNGFGHINFNPFDDCIDDSLFARLDAFLKETPAIPRYLLLYHTPAKLLRYWAAQDKEAFRVRTRRRYQIDRRRFLQLDESSYAVPPGHRLELLRDCPYEDLESFGLSLDTKFYDSRAAFLRDSFGYVLYDDFRRPVSISYLICLVGRNTECDLKTLPEFRGKGYGFTNITNYVRYSLSRGIDVGWDCFADNPTDGWVQRYGYTDVREYDFVTFLK